MGENWEILGYFRFFQRFICHSLLFGLLAHSQCLFSRYMIWVFIIIIQNYFFRMFPCSKSTPDCIEELSYFCSPLLTDLSCLKFRVYGSWVTQKVRTVSSKVDNSQKPFKNSNQAMCNTLFEGTTSISKYVWNCSETQSFEQHL